MRFYHSPFLLPFTAVHVLALPSPSVDLENPWVPEPTRRGTAGLILSCMLTLTLCAWTAIHLNVIPSGNDATMRRQLLSKTKWMLTALFAPEVVLWCAFCQWVEARAVHREWLNHFKIKDDKLDRLGIEGAFFVVMGGFTIAHHKHLETIGGACTITPSVFIELMKDGTISEDILDKKIIIDKGKASTLAKALVCFQALWMVVQCVARKVEGLPLTLLELHVVMHVACAVAMYGFWWHKPLDVNEQISLTEDRELSSLLSILYKPPCTPYCTLELTIFPGPQVPHVYGAPTPLSDSTQIDQLLVNLHGSKEPTPVNKNGLEIISSSHGNHWDPEILEFHLRELPGDRHVVLFPGESLTSEDGFSLSVPEENDWLYTLNATDIENIGFAVNAARKGRYAQRPWNRIRITIGDRDRAALVSRMKNHKVAGAIVRDVSRSFYLLITCCIVYGACHAGAYFSYFPTPAEWWLWQMSCVVIGFFPCLLLYLAVLDSQPNNPSDGLNIPLFGIFGVVRVFLMVESFISLRSLPKGAYDTVEWASYWPHL